MNESGTPNPQIKRSKKHSSHREKRMKGGEKEIKICKFLNPQVREKLEKEARSMKLVSEERRKIEATSQYFKQYWLALVQHHHSRRIRNGRVKKREAYLRDKVITEEEKEEYIKAEYEKESYLLRLQRIRMSKQDFMLLAILGRGGFGEVYLARKRDTGEVVALKKMSKKMFLQKNDLTKVKRERAVMVQHDSPWLIKLKYSFQTGKHVFLAMEFAPGGDMKNLLDHVGCFSEDHCRFYISEMLEAVTALHKMGYIHRDLKPDNYLVDRSGHLKLIDFGLSKDGLLQKYGGTLTLKMNSAHNGLRTQGGTQNSRRSHPAWNNTLSRRKQFTAGRKTYSVVGSPEYMAIEILEEVGYNHTVDFWSIGVILYELFYGITPFASEHVEETFQKLAVWQDYIVPPEPIDENEEAINRDAWDLITKLLQESGKRLGTNGVDEIRNHRFFEGMKWKELFDVHPPFVPSLSNDLDTSYYNDALTEEDYSSLSVDAKDIQEILDANLHDADSIPLHLLNLRPVETDQKCQSTHFANEYEQKAFAGWTYRHDDIETLMNKLEMDKNN